MPSAYKSRKKLNRGFTLVELLIAISLIGILTGVLLAVLNPRGIQAKARDSQRISDLSKVKVALELYFADNRSYPIYNDFYALRLLAPPFGLLDSKYINKLPVDPKNSSAACIPGVTWRDYGYISIDGKKYVLATNMETSSMGSSTCPTGIPVAWCHCTFTGGTGYYTTAD